MKAGKNQRKGKKEDSHFVLVAPAPPKLYVGLFLHPQTGMHTTLAPPEPKALLHSTPLSSTRIPKYSESPRLIPPATPEPCFPVCTPPKSFLLYLLYQVLPHLPYCIFLHTSASAPGLIVLPIPVASVLPYTHCFCSPCTKCSCTFYIQSSYIHDPVLPVHLVLL